MTIRTLAMTLALTASAAFANDHLNQIRNHARTLEDEFRGMQSLVKAKKLDAADLQSRLSWTQEQVGKLQALAQEFEAANPQATSSPDWKKTKDLVALLGIFHEQKTQAATAGNKGLLKAHLDSQILRAAKLQAAASQALESGGL